MAKNGMISLKEKLNIPVHTNQWNRCREEHIKAGQKKEFKILLERERKLMQHILCRKNSSNPSTSLHYIILKLGIGELS